ncbi:MAG: rhodanese-related sulfurtransferase [Rhodothermaceae bacterium]
MEDYNKIRKPLLNLMKELDIKGTLLLAEEGINGTISGTRSSINELLTWLKSDSRFKNLSHKESFSEKHAFYRTKVKLKKEIVTMGIGSIDPVTQAGTYVKPENWNDLINDPDVILVDTRNDYEVEIGTFNGAINPDIKSFREFPEWIKNNLDPAKTKKVAMFCTGGIRCEKSTSLLKNYGFENVYHLEGGILKYFEEVDENKSEWDGDCFVFDQRIAVNHKLEKSKYDQCYACRMPITEEDKKSEKYVAGVSCHNCFSNTSSEQKIRFSERSKQIQLSKKRGERHIG